MTETRYTHEANPGGFAALALLLLLLLWPTPAQTRVTMDESEPQRQMPAQTFQAQVQPALAHGVPSWLPTLDTPSYAALLAMKLESDHRHQPVLDAVQESRSIHLNALVGKYLEYAFLQQAELWCELPMGSTDIAHIEYLLWLQGDLSASDYNFSASGFSCFDKQTRLVPVAHTTDSQMLQPAIDQSLELDPTLSTALKNFQWRHSLEINGTLDEPTLAMLRRPAVQIMQGMSTNIHRMAERGLETAGAYALVNIPAYQMTVYEEEHVQLTMKTIVGKRSRPTPELSGAVQYVVFNPDWNVPAKLAYKDIIPKQIRYGDYLQKRNIQVLDVANDNTLVHPDMLDWREMRNHFPYRLRQAPGKNNALGQYKFTLPNKRAIFLHDTNNKKLFDKKKRAYSSGCVRLEDPRALADYLLQSEAERIDYWLAGGNTKYVKPPQSLPVHFVYWTHWVDEQGRLRVHKDVYNKDPAVLDKIFEQDSGTPQLFSLSQQ